MSIYHLARKHFDLILFMQLNPGGRAQTHATHFAFDYFSGVLGAAFKVGYLDFGDQVVSPLNACKRWSNELAARYFTATNKLSLGCFENAFYSKLAENCLFNFGSKQARKLFARVVDQFVNDFVQTNCYFVT